MRKLRALFLTLVFAIICTGCTVEIPEESITADIPMASETQEETAAPKPPASQTVSEISASQTEQKQPASQTEAEEKNDAPILNGETLSVHFIDVGQADSSLILCGEKAMLIDGGNVADSSVIVTYLRNLGLSHLDYMVCTHAHEDHVGGLSGPLHTVTVGEIYAPVTESESKAYTNFKKASLKQVSEIKHPKPGDTVTLGKSTISFLGPVNENYEDINNTSIVLKAKFGETSFLFTGDAEREAENDIIGSGADLKSTVLKVGHHGSSSSSSYVFLREVMPQYAVISVGKGNSYGHPDNDVLSRLRDAGASVYRTDLQGDVIAVSDGKNVTFTTKKNENIQTNPTVSEKQTEALQQQSVKEAYIGNLKMKKFHRTSCSSLPSEKNRIYFDSRDAVLNDGYIPCKNCNP